MTSHTRTVAQLRVLLVGVSLGAAGCPASDPEAEACDPLQSAGSATVKLDGVVAIGKAADGRFFAVDQPDEAAEHRLFVSEGDSLVRREIAGAGSQHEESFDRIGLLVSGEVPLRVLVELRGKDVRMAIVEGDAANDRAFELDRPGAEALTVVGASAIAGLAIRDLPGDTVVEYSARVEDGLRLVVIRPQHDWSYDDFRLFYGPPDRLEEREVQEVSRARDGGSTHILFDLESEQADAFFPNRLTGNGSEILDEPATLEIGSKELAVERLPRDAPDLDALVFFCGG